MYPKVWCTYRVVVFLFNPPAFLHFLSPLSSPFRIFPLNEKRQLEAWWTLQITLLFAFVLFFFSHFYSFLSRLVISRGLCVSGHVARASLWAIGLVPERRPPLLYLGFVTEIHSPKRSVKTSSFYLMNVQTARWCQSREWEGGVAVCHAPNFQFALRKQMGGQSK